MAIIFGTIVVGMAMFAVVILVTEGGSSDDGYTFREKRNNLYECKDCGCLSRGHTAIRGREKDVWCPEPLCPYGCNYRMNLVKDTKKTKRALRKMSLIEYWIDKWRRDKQKETERQESVNKALKNTLRCEGYGEFRQSPNGDYYFKIDGQWIRVSKEEISKKFKEDSI